MEMAWHGQGRGAGRAWEAVVRGQRPPVAEAVSRMSKDCRVSGDGACCVQTRRTRR